MQYRDDEFYRRTGFENVREMNELVCLVPLETEEEKKNFDYWKEHGGHKEGLLHLLGVHRFESEDIYTTKEAVTRWFKYLSNKRLREYYEEVQVLQRKLKSDLNELSIQEIYATIAE